MSPFKEPQPRKQPTDQANGWKAREAKGRANSMPNPTLEDLGERPRGAELWPEEKVEQVKQEFTVPLRDTPSTLDVAVRTAALQAAAVMQGTQTSAIFWGNITALETYLREGKQP